MSQKQQTFVPSFDLLSVLKVLLRARRVIAVWAVLAAIAGLVTALVVKPYYTATAIILPPQQQQSIASALSAQLPQLAGASSLSLGLKNPGDMYVGIMQGRTVSDSVIAQLHLDQVFHSTLHSGTVGMLQHAMAFESSRDGLIRITAKASSAQLAADIANAYVDALYRMNASLAITEAAQRRLFFQQQLDEEKKLLNAAEENLKALQQKTGMIQLSGQTELLLREIATVQGEITSHEVQIRSLSTYATAENPEMRQAQEELSALRHQLDQLQSKQRAVAPSGTSTIDSAGEVPAAGLEYVRKLRDVQYHESLFTALSKQYEGARLDEAKSASVLQVVDRALPADRKAGPSRTLILVLFVIGGVVLGMVFAVVRAFLPALRGTFSDTPGTPA